MIVTAYLNPPYSTVVEQGVVKVVFQVVRSRLAVCSRCLEWCRQASAMLSQPASRRSVMARLRIVAMTAGPLPVLSC